MASSKVVPAYLGAVLLSAVLGAAPAGAAILNVGTGGPAAGCEASSVEGAIALAAATAEADEIRVVNTVQFSLAGGLHLTDWTAVNHGPLTIAGRFSSCTDTTPDGADRSEIVFGGAAPVIEIDTSGVNTSTVTLRGLLIGGSDGRGVLVQGNSTVDLLDVELTLNSGGGLAVESGASVYLDGDTEIVSNGPAVEGGGIHCSGATSEVISGAVIGFNEAMGGGGVSVESGCEVLFDPGSRLVENQAVIGGGLYAAGGALVSALSGGLVIDYNHAASSGGGLAAEGAGTTVLLEGAAIGFNEAGFAGGGIMVGASATVVMGAQAPCGALPVCQGALWWNDLTGSAQHGAAAVVYNGGQLRLYQTFVEHNQVPDAAPSGSILHAEGAGATIRTESVQVAVNTGASSVFQGASGATIDVRFTTVAYNYRTSTGGDQAEGLRVEGTGTVGRINTSIFYPTGGYHAGAGTVVDSIDCLITQTTAGLPGGEFVYVVDPRYTNPATGDLRPRPGSPAVDFCDDLVAVPTTRDLGGLLRGHDHPTDPNGSPGAGEEAIFDAGAYELWELFADGFATGDTSRWSGVTP